MRDGIYDALFDERVFQEMQAPAHMTIGRGTADQSDQMCFAITIEETLLALFLFFTMYGELGAALDKALAQSTD